MRKKKLANYIVLLEDKFFNFINYVENNINDVEELKKEINNIKSTTFYKDVRWSNADNIEKIRIMHETNNFQEYEEDPSSKIGT